jgi:ATP-dependent DNA ligase
LGGQFRILRTYCIFWFPGLPSIAFSRYLPAMLLRQRSAARPSGFVEPCRPSRAPRPPSGPGWIHEIKHDGYRLLVRREGSRVRLFTRGGYDWTDRFPAIVEAASTIKARSFLIDGGSLPR